MAVKVVILGGSFGGLTAAYELRRQLGAEKASITLLSKEPRFTFVPSLPWVAMGGRNLEQISFDLAGPLARKQVAFANETVLHIDPENRSVTTDRAEHRYDFLVIATGHRSANEAVEGLGPFAGPGHSLMSAPEAEELHT
ncbi:MAG: NAD(P)/FAD-dependent oxidoreductase, partial [Acidimicrobiales bacterium]